MNSYNGKRAYRANVRILETAVRDAREKILQSAGELEGREFDRARCRLYVAAFQLSKIASGLRHARKENAEPETRLAVHNYAAAELNRVGLLLDEVDRELAPWPVRAWRATVGLWAAWWAKATASSKARSSRPVP